MCKNCTKQVKPKMLFFIQVEAPNSTKAPRNVLAALFRARSSIFSFLLSTNVSSTELEQSFFNCARQHLHVSLISSVAYPNNFLFASIKGINSVFWAQLLGHHFVLQIYSNTPMRQKSFFGIFHLWTKKPRCSLL